MSSALISREITSIDILSHNARKGAYVACHLGHILRRKPIQMSLTSHSYIIACQCRIVVRSYIDCYKALYAYYLTLPLTSYLAYVENSYKRSSLVCFTVAYGERRFYSEGTKTDESRSTEGVCNGIEGGGSRSSSGYHETVVPLSS